MRIVFWSHAERAFGKLRKPEQQLVWDKLRVFANSPFDSPNLKKLRGFQNRYRLRIGRWRVLLAIIFDEQKIEIADIFMEKGNEDYRRRQKSF